MGSAHRAHEDVGDDARHHREQRRERLEEAERAAGVAGETELDGVADELHRAVGERAYRPELRQLVENDDREDDSGRDPQSARRQA